MRFTTLADWLAWQETLHPKAVDLGMERVREVHARMGLTRPAPVVITVAGTNGKGSCVAFLDAILRSAGYRVGAYTSPHLLRYNERVLLDGTEATDDDLVAAFQTVDEARGDTSLTYFEFGTLAALHLFERAQLGAALLEVGLGGRLDAVNIVDADCALITTIGVDHVDWLGPDRKSIAKEKAGIMRADCPAVFGDRDMPQAIETEAERIGARLHRLGQDFDYRVDNGTWSWSSVVGAAFQPRPDRDPHAGAQPGPGSGVTTPRATREDVPHSVRPEPREGERPSASRRTHERIPLPTLAGDYQLDNAAACLMVLESLADRIPAGDDAIAEGLRTARLAGRLQRIELDGVEVILDVAHNPQAAACLASALDRLPEKRPRHAVFAQLADKDATGVVKALGDRFDHWYLAGLDGPRGQSGVALAARLEGRLHHDRVTVCRDVRHATDVALHQAGETGRVVVFGSFHTVESVARAPGAPSREVSAP